VKKIISKKKKYFSEKNKQDVKLNIEKKNKSIKKSVEMELNHHYRFCRPIHYLYVIYFSR
jgi:hypothetical protein